MRESAKRARAYGKALAPAWAAYDKARADYDKAVADWAKTVADFYKDKA